MCSPHRWSFPARWSVIAAIGRWVGAAHLSLDSAFFHLREAVGRSRHCQQGGDPFHYHSTTHAADITLQYRERRSWHHQKCSRLPPCWTVKRRRVLRSRPREHGTAGWASIALLTMAVLDGSPLRRDVSYLPRLCARSVAVGIVGVESVARLWMDWNIESRCRISALLQAAASTETIYHASFSLYSPTILPTRASTHQDAR